MKKIDLGQTISILANLGVIAGIGFLAFELRQNSEFLESQTLFNHTQVRLNASGPLYHYPEIADIFVKKNDGSTLSPAEVRILSDLYTNLFTVWEWEFREYQDGKLTTLPVAGYQFALTGDVPGGGKQWPGLLEHWSFAKNLHSTEFVEWMEQNVIGPVSR